MMIFSSVVAKLELAMEQHPSVGGQPVVFADNADKDFDRTVPILPKKEAINSAARAAGFYLDGAAKVLPAPIVGLPAADLSMENVPNQEVGIKRNVGIIKVDNVKLLAADRGACVNPDASDSDDSDGDALIPEEWLAFRYCHLLH